MQKGAGLKRPRLFAFTQLLGTFDIRPTFWYFEYMKPLLVVLRPVCFVLTPFWLLLKYLCTGAIMASRTMRAAGRVPKGKWEDCAYPIREELCVTVPGDPGSVSRMTLWQTLFTSGCGWGPVAVVAAADKTKPYRLGLAQGTGRRKEIHSALNPKGSSVGLRVGREALNLFALDEDGNQLPVEIVRMTVREIWKGTLL